jgi:hypothetical protein
LVKKYGKIVKCLIKYLWLFCFQESETCDVMWARTDKIREMMGSGEFLSAWFYPYFDEMVENGRRNHDP